MASRDSDNAGYGGNGVSAKEAYMVANQAMKIAEEHIRDCKEFRRSLSDAQERARQERHEMHRQNTASLEKVRGEMSDDAKALRELISSRTAGLYKLLWGEAIAVIGFLVYALWDVIKAGMHP